MEITLTTTAITAVSLLAVVHSSHGESQFPREGSRATASLEVNTSPNRSVLTAHVFGSGCAVALGSDGKLRWSTGGTKGRPADLPVEQFLRRVAFGNGRFLAVGGFYFGGGAIILTSINGRSWRQERRPSKQVLHGVAYFDGRFIAVGAKGTILTSRSSRSWLEQKSGTDATLATIACGNGLVLIGVMMA
jgi:hypothetical protein